MNPILHLFLSFLCLASACSYGGYSIKKLSFKSQDHPTKSHYITATLERGDHLSLKIDGKTVINTYLDFSSTPPVNFAAGIFQGEAVVVYCSRSQLPDVAKDTSCNVSVNGSYIGLLSFSLML